MNSIVTRLILGYNSQQLSLGLKSIRIVSYTHLLFESSNSLILRALVKGSTRFSFLSTSEARRHFGSRSLAPGNSDTIYCSIWYSIIFCFAYRINHSMLLETLPANSSSIQDKYVARHASAVITIWMKIEISISHKFQISVTIDKPLVFSISQILKNCFRNLSILLIWIRLVPTHYF